MLGHNMIEILQENYLSFFVRQLKVTTNNGYDMLISPIVDMASHGCPIFDTFDVIRHDSCMLKINMRFLLIFHMSYLKR